MAVSPLRLLSLQNDWVFKKTLLNQCLYSGKHTNVYLLLVEILNQEKGDPGLASNSYDSLTIVVLCS